MKKTFDPANIMNELRGQSAFFPTKAPQPLPEQSGEPREQQELPQLQPEISNSSPVRDVPQYDPYP